MRKIHAVATALQKDSPVTDPILGVMGTVYRETKPIVTFVWACNEDEAIIAAEEEAETNHPGYKAIISASLRLDDASIRDAAHDLGMKEV